MMSCRDVVTPDLFPGAPAERHPPLIAAALRAFDAWKRAGARRNAWQYQVMIEHVKAQLARKGLR